MKKAVIALAMSSIAAASYAQDRKPAAGQPQLQVLQQQIDALSSKVTQLEAALAAIPRGGSGLRVLDSTNNEVGMLLQQGMFAARVGDQWIGVPFTEAGVVESGVTLMYETADCSGPAYVRAQRAKKKAGSLDGPPNEVEIVLGPNGSVSFYDFALETVTTRTMQSTLFLHSSGNTQCSPFPSSQVVGTARSFNATMNAPLRIEQ